MKGAITLNEMHIDYGTMKCEVFFTKDNDSHHMVIDIRLFQVISASDAEWLNRQVFSMLNHYVQREIQIRGGE